MIKYGDKCLKIEYTKMLYYRKLHDLYIRQKK